MPWIRYKHWATDGRPAWKAIVPPNHEWVFLKVDEGVCHVPYLKDCDYLLRHDSKNYELCWEKYGVLFDADGKEVLHAQEVQQKIEEVLIDPVNNEPPKRKPGRPRKVR